MIHTTAPHLAHLRRLTDPLGVIASARGDQPDRFAGYDTLDNADALRLCATVSDTVEGAAFRKLAGVYHGFLSRGRREDGGVHHHCDARGGWTDNGDEPLVQARLARALSAVIVSELPIKIRLWAAHWWRDLIRLADRARTPRAAAHWLIAIGQLRSADPGRDLGRARRLADWLVEDCYDRTRSGGWEWFEPQWTPTAACLPAGLWAAFELLEDQRYAGVARVTTQFLIDHLFEDGLLLPVGTCGGWSGQHDKAIFDQLPAEVCSIVESLCTAERVAGVPAFGTFAMYAHRWFTGNNVRGAEMIDPQTGGCYDAITASGIDGSQGASAAVSCLLSQAAVSGRTVILEEPPIYAGFLGG